MDDANKMREAFENYASNGGQWPKPLERFAGEYNLMQTASAWVTWKCAWKAALAEQPAQGATAAVPRFTYGHCAERQKAGGCTRHNLHCGYPDCDRKEVPRG